MTNTSDPKSISANWPLDWKNTGFNGCLATAAAALRYLANNDRPLVGNTPYNAEHLIYTAHELDLTQQKLLAENQATIDRLTQEVTAWRTKYPDQALVDAEGVVSCAPPTEQTGSLQEALTEIRDRLRDHPAYAELTEEGETDVGGDTAELSYLVRIANIALAATGVDANPSGDPQENRVDEYLAKAKLVLMAYNHGEASWPGITTAEFNEVKGLVDELLMLKWDRDCDGAKPVGVVLWDKATHQMPWTIPLKIEVEEESISVENTRLLSNMRIVSGAISAYAEELHRMEQRLAELASQVIRNHAAFPVFQVNYQKTEGANVLHARSLHLREVAARAFIPPAGFKKQEIMQRWAVPRSGSNPTNDFEHYRTKVSDVCETLVTQFDVLEKLGLQTTDPREDAKA